MKKKLLLSLVVLLVPLFLFAQEAKTTAKVAATTPVKKVSFNVGNDTKSPFISKEEALKIEAAKKAAIQAEIDAQNAARIAWEQQQKEIRRKKILCDETKRHPARAVEKNIHLDGILGKDVIINGLVMSKGTKFVVPVKLAKDLEGCDFNYDPSKYKVKVVDIKDDSVWLVYKGERFQVKLPLL